MLALEDVKFPGFCFQAPRIPRSNRLGCREDEAQLAPPLSEAQHHPLMGMQVQPQDRLRQLSVVQIRTRSAHHVGTMAHSRRGTEDCGPLITTLSERCLQGWRWTSRLRHSISLWCESQDASVEDGSAVFCKLNASKQY